MDLKELHSFKMSDAVTFHDNLNPKLFRGQHLRPEVELQLKTIAEDFLQEMGIHDLDVRDITISGSNAAYSYTDHSDLDLHILVNMNDLPNDKVYREFFKAKKDLYNDSHDITINKIPVELYIQDAAEPVVSLGEYSIKDKKWLKIPTKRRANFDQTATKAKYEKLLDIIETALKSNKLSKIQKVLKKIKQYRQAGLDKGGEFGPENLAYKALRSQGYITKLYDLRDKLHSKKLSVETMYQPVRDEVNEAFDQPYRLKWEQGDHGDIDAYAKLDDGNYLSIMFNKGYNQDKEEAWNVEFFRNNSQEVTGEGDAQRVFATVLSAIQKFIKKYKPNKVIFSASKEVEPGQNAQSRARLYDSLVQRYSKAWGYRAFRADTGNKVIYELSRRIPVAEARSNPEQNVKLESGMKDLEAIANTISDPENWAVSMTSEPKLGINPQVGISEDTPKGIYFYPLNYVLGKIHSRKPLPWGNDYPYIQLFQYDRSGEMTQQTQVDSAKLKQALSQYCSDEIIQQALDDPEYDGTPYWTIYDCLSRLGKSDETNVVRWNKVLRDLGFTSVYDPGNGWIAYNEPTQGVVLDPRIIKQHKTILNRKESKVITPASIAKSLFDEIDMELARNRIWQMYDPDGSKLKQAVKKYAAGPDFKPFIGKTHSQELEDKIKGYRLYGARQLSDVAMAWYKAQQPVNEASGYIPSEKEKKDPRFKTALTVDVKPDSIKKNAKAFSWLTDRAGIPPTAKPSGKI